MVGQGNMIGLNSMRESLGPLGSGAVLPVLNSNANAAPSASSRYGSTAGHGANGVGGMSRSIQTALMSFGESGMPI
jgi:hypothetical protein